MTDLDGQGDQRSLSTKERETLLGLISRALDDDQDGYRLAPDLEKEMRAALTVRERVSEQDVIAYSPSKDTAEWANIGDQEKAHWRTMAEAAREEALDLLELAKREIESPEDDLRLGIPVHAKIRAFLRRHGRLTEGDSQ
jgi:hypothetical protein